MEIIDTHAHLDWSSYRDDLNSVIETARNEGVGRIITVGTCLESSRRAVSIAQAHENVFATAGWHPNDVSDVTDDLWSQLEETAAQPEVVAIGETGLDFYRDSTPPDTQREFFSRHLDLAERLARPVVLHIRESAEEALAFIEQRRPKASLIWHCFSGTAEQAARAVQMDMSFSVGGSLTYRKNDELRGAVAGIPPERIMLETDCPFLVPHPLRGKVRRNEPAMVVHTLRVLAQLLGSPPEAIAATTTANARRVFRID